MHRYLKLSCGLSLVALLGTSCQKEALIIPDQPASVASTSGRSKSLPPGKGSGSSNSNSSSQGSGSGSSNRDKPYESLITSSSTTKRKYRDGKEIGSTNKTVGVYEDEYRRVTFETKPNNNKLVEVDKEGDFVVTQFTSKKMRYVNGAKVEETGRTGFLYLDKNQRLQYDRNIPGNTQNGTGGSQRVN